MKKAEFWRVIRETPICVPVFVLVEVPRWGLQYGLAVGEKFFYEVDNLRRNKNGLAYDIKPSYLKFVGYEPTVRR
jgi:hypothetical protein